jgi:hypothetical protein
MEIGDLIALVALLLWVLSEVIKLRGRKGGDR